MDLAIIYTPSESQAALKPHPSHTQAAPKPHTSRTQACLLHSLTTLAHCSLLSHPLPTLALSPLLAGQQLMNIVVAVVVVVVAADGHKPTLPQLRC